MAYVFSDDEATVQIQVNPHRYVVLNGKEISPRPYAELVAGKRVVKWDYKSAQYWVPPNVATDLTTATEEMVQMGQAPVATILGTRQLPAKVVEDKPARRPAAQ